MNQNIVNKFKNAKNNIIFIVTILVSLLFIFGGYNYFSDYKTENYDDVEIVRAKVLSIDNIEETESFLSNINKRISFTAEITSGKEKGQTHSIDQILDSFLTMQDKEIAQGDKILIAYTDYTESNEFEWTFIGYNRLDALLILSGVFILLLLIIGGRKGINTIISLILTCLVIFLVYIPSVLSGFNIYISTTIVGAFIIFMSLIIINGVNKKTICAIAGNIGGVIVAALIAMYMNNILKLSGFVDDDFLYLSLVNPESPLNLVAIIWGGMVLGSLGAIMDVAMTIASSMNELAEHMHEKSFTKMLRCGLNIGRDAIGTMTNTLILAYIGSSLALVMLLIVNTKNTLFLFSLEMIAVQVVQSLMGIIGILLAVPITAGFSAFIYNRKKTGQHSKEQ